MAEMAGMSKLSEMSVDYLRAARHATIHPVSEMSKKAKMSNMITRHVMHSPSKPAV
jgi:hypothetical protein